MKLVIYKGFIHSNRVGGQLVTKDDDILPLEPSLKLRNHSPIGFNWGYGGSGPAQLALALLLDVTGNGEVAVQHHQEFKWDIVARWRGDWTITSEEIELWLKDRAE